MTEKRKTLADIRREIDAEFPPLEDEPTDDADAVLDERTLALRVPRRWPARRSYLLIALLATIAVELFVLGYLAGRLYRDEPLAAVPSTVTGSAIASTPPAASVTSAPAPPAVAPEAPPRVAAVEAQPAPVAAVREPTPPPEPQRPAPEAKPVTSDAVRAMTDASRVKPDAGRVVPQPRGNMPGASVVTLTLPGPGDWVESQSQLRKALREWLRLSGYAGSGSQADDAEVILNADGQTAKTRLPVRVGNHVIIREQRWKRDARGWSVVEEHQVQSPRPR